MDTLTFQILEDVPNVSSHFDLHVLRSVFPSFFHHILGLPVIELVLRYQHLLHLLLDVGVGLLGQHSHPDLLVLTVVPQHAVQLAGHLLLGLRLHSKMERTLNNLIGGKYFCFYHDDET